jgi:hypothetical protein
MNTLTGMNIVVNGETYDMGEYMGIALDILNTHVSTYASLQIVSNPAYEDASILYAENSKVEVIVDTYADGLNDVVRERFHQTIVGKDGVANGFVWSLVNTIPDVTLPYITLADIEKFEENRIAFFNELAAQIGADNAKEAVKPYMLYLAFEKAIIEASKGGTLSVESFMALADLENSSALADVMAAMDFDVEELAAAVEASKANQDEVYKEIYNTLVDQLRGYHSKVWATTQNFYYSLYKFVYSIETIEEEFSNDLVTLTKEELTAKISAGLYENYYAYLATEEELADEAWVSLQKNRADRWAAEIVDVCYNGGKSEKYVKIDGKNTLVDCKCDGLNNLYNTYFTLYFFPENMVEGMCENKVINGLLNILGRCLIGNGIGTHPSANGHNDLFEAVRKSYVDGYRTVDKTVDDFRILCEYLYAHREEIYAQAYKQAEIAGIIAAINGSLDNAVAAVKYAEAWAFEYEEYFMGEDFALQINASVESTIATIEALRTLINEAKVLDEKIYDNAVALLAQLKANVAELATLVNIAAEDAYIYGTEVLLPAVDAEVAKIVEAAMA